jgi:FkbM family methyltransferase
MPNLEQARELASVLMQPGGWHAFTCWKPFSITAFRIVSALKNQGLRFSTIIDGGANVGQLARAAAELYPEARVITIEALPDVADQLQRNLSDLQRVRVIRSAIGEEEREITFHRSSYTLASSVLSPHADYEKSFPGQSFSAVHVPMSTLDTLLSEETLTPPVLLKLDLQGYELQALRGATGTLEHTDYLLLETTFKPMYENEPHFEDVYALLHQAGFRFQNPIDFLTDGSGEIIQMDALFEKLHQ